MYQVGIKNVVALLGTALADTQANLIKKYTNNVILALDSDLAGQMATLRVIEMCNIKSKVICMKGAKDLDEYVNKFGAIKFKMLIDNASNVLKDEGNKLG